ncbi:Gfo/Idh/MocA family protein [Bacillus timonensis]|uniref:Gfo/Idh/MocA family protein n=1 Tax=Bacillus timonensis TaxID=1033734 RepID=UPI000304E343|nr:Gfo/Idh/MocA family oxidoreductase [Bacillus timonensis]
MGKIDRLGTFFKQQSGGIIVDLFIHDFDLLRWLTGQEIQLISGYMAKNILPEYPSFYDVACLHVVMEGGVTAQLYADWHTPNKSWTWGDGRIFIVGTSGVAEYRLEGDPIVGKDSVGYKVTNDAHLLEIKEESAPITITRDFINRINGEVGLVTHHDILAATTATIDADEKAELIGALNVENV